MLYRICRKLLKCVEISKLNLLLGREDSYLFIHFSNKPVLVHLQQDATLLLLRRRKLIIFFCSFCFSLIILLAVKECKCNSCLGVSISW